MTHGFLTTANRGERSVAPPFGLRFWVWACGAIGAGAMVRLFFILKYPFESVDSFYYRELANNWLYHHVYGLFINGQLIPADIRAPGYPAFLVLMATVFGQSGLAIRLAQCMVDLGTCVLTGALAAEIAPRNFRRRIFLIALWLAALCPFTANYTAAILTETLATFVTCAALLFLMRVQRLTDSASQINGQMSDQQILRATAMWFGAGLLAGIGALIRPETPILLIPFGLLLLWRSWQRRQWKNFFLFIAWAAAGIVMCLSPWATRNAVTMGRVQFLAPRYANSAGDYMPRGFYSWTQTWLVRYRDVYLFPWKLYGGRISPDDLPASAADSRQERATVVALLEDYDRGPQMTPAIDHQFAKLARERTRRNPLRTYVWVPFARVLSMWFTPRLELLPVHCQFWPEKGEPWTQQTSFLFTGWLELAAIIYIGLGLAGAGRRRCNSIALALILFVAIRTLLMTQLQTVEPRYVVVCFPIVAAFGANALAGWRTARIN
jgi:4-amino-4-deoxy-L-arabinose transferase-like glycosyltransferase